MYIIKKTREYLIKKVVYTSGIVFGWFLLPVYVFAGTTILTSCGTLDKNGEMYILANDVRSDGTCFSLNSTGSTLDLGGHAVTYADIDFTGIENPGFETGGKNQFDVPGWDLSGAHGHAYRQDYTKQLFFDRYSLRIDNIAGDAYKEESVATSPVYLPVAGQYALTAEVRGGPYGPFLATMAIEGVETTCSNTVSNMHTSVETDMSWDMICEFTVTAPNTVKGKILLKTKDETKNTYLNIDEVDIRPIGFGGIKKANWNKNMAEIKNGTIREGRSKAIYSPAIDTTFAKKIHHLTLVTNGINSENIKEVWGGDFEIYDNYLEANGKLPLNRQYPFSMINLERTSGGNHIYNNTLLNGPHVGINHGNATGGVLNPKKSEIWGNTIKTKIIASNGFAINAGSNLDIFDNAITPIQGHGIGLGRDSDSVRIFDNTIEPSTWPCSEYSTYFYSNSAHGIRIKNYGSGALDNVEIFGNTITGHTNPQLSSCYTHVTGITNYIADDAKGGPISSNVTIHDNVISVNTDNYLQQHAIAYEGQGFGEFYNNTLTSNHILIELSDSDGGGISSVNKVFKDNTLIKAGNSPGFYTFRYGYFSPKNNTFVNTVFRNGADMRNISFGNNNAGASYSDVADLTKAWTVTFFVKNEKGMPVADALITINPSNSLEKILLSTDAFGRAEKVLTEDIFHYKNVTTKSYDIFSPYTLTVSKTGFATVTSTLEVKKPITVNITLGIKSSSVDGANSSSTQNTLDKIAPKAPTGLAVF